MRLRTITKIILMCYMLLFCGCRMGEMGGGE